MILLQPPMLNNSFEEAQAELKLYNDQYEELRKKLVAPIFKQEYLAVNGLSPALSFNLFNEFVIPASTEYQRHCKYFNFLRIMVRLDDLKKVLPREKPARLFLNHLIDLTGQLSYNAHAQEDLDAIEQVITCATQLVTDPYSKNLIRDTNKAADQMRKTIAGSFIQQPGLSRTARNVLIGLCLLGSFALLAAGMAILLTTMGAGVPITGLALMGSAVLLSFAQLLLSPTEKILNTPDEVKTKATNSAKALKQFAGSVKATLFQPKASKAVAQPSPVAHPSLAGYRKIA